MRSVFLALALLSGCSERWVAWDELEVPFTGPGLFDVTVTTEPEAFPDELYDAALRGSVDVGALRLVDDGHELLQGDKGWVNVLDAWDGCAPEETCVETFRFEVSCRGECEGLLSFDAFLAVQARPGLNPPPEPEPGELLRLSLTPLQTEGP